MQAEQNLNIKGHLLIIDDDKILADRLSLAMTKRGFEVRTAYSVAEGLSLAKSFEPEYAVIDLRLEDGNGLQMVAELRTLVEDCRIIMLTAYGNIATAVAAVKAGAVDYLAKPADADAVLRALLQTENSDFPSPPQDPMPADRLKWEYILRIYEQTGRNISETARRLKMHRRTLQRILAKYPPKEQN
jgi:two-component system response regulator RegA